MSQLTSLSTTFPSSVKLSDRPTFQPWYAQLRYQAQALGVWSQIDPDMPPGAANPLSEAPEVPDLATADVDALRLYQIKLSIHQQLATKLQAIWSLIYATVDSHVLELAILRSEDQSLYALLKALKADLCPSKEDWKEQVRRAYREVLLEPHRGCPPPDQWVLNWYKAYANAKSVDLDEIKGELPIKDFLRAASKYNNTWAIRELETLTRPTPVGVASGALSLEQYAAWFSELTHTKETNHREGVYATLGALSDRRHSCPCREKGQHSWKPADCARLEHALRGSAARGLSTPPTADEAADIKKRLDGEQYKSLREALKKKGWLSMYPGSVSA